MTEQREALEQVSELVRLESGVSLKPTQRRALEAAIRRAAPGEDARGFLELASDPVRGRELVQRLLDEVTIQETAFLRNAHELEAIDWRALLRAAQERDDDRVRVWAAGCATGEEAYSLALLARESFGGEEPPVDVLGTDISKAALSAAEEGRYRRRSVAGLERPLLERYFTRDGTTFSVRESLRRPVRFLRHNLVRDPVPPLGEPRFDLVVCRNVLIYFDGPTVERVIGALERALRPRGTLLLGAADSLQRASKRLAEATAPAAGAPTSTKERPAASPAELLASALRAADEGRATEALETTSALLREDPLNAEAYFVRGMVELAEGASAAAPESLRRALYVDPSFSVAAFTLARAYEELGEAAEALRAYEHALRTLDPEDDRHEALLAQVDLGDIAAACRARIKALT